MDDERFFQALVTIWPKLQHALGPAWPKVEASVLGAYRRLAAGIDATGAIQDIFARLRKIPRAEQLLLQAIATTPLSIRETSARNRHKFNLFIRVPVFFATNRIAVPIRKGRESTPYGGASSGPMKFGMCDVSIPDDHRMGALEAPRWSRLEFRINPARHVAIMSCEECTMGALGASLRRRDGRRSPRSALIFLHGYNVSFENAIRRAAQIGYDIGFDGAVFAFSWPSKARASAYIADSEKAAESQMVFSQFLDKCIAELRFGRIHVVAHSMGNSILTEAIRAGHMRNTTSRASRLGHIVLAAPDVDAQHFRKIVGELPLISGRYTLYASSKDRALKLSRRIHGRPRAGESGKHLLIAKNIDTVDATNVRTDFLGHSYFGDHRAIISDIFQLIHNSHPPDDRNLTKIDDAQGTHWRFPLSRY